MARYTWPLFQALLVSYATVAYASFLSYRGIEQTRFQGFETGTSDVFFSILAVIVVNVTAIYHGRLYATTSSRHCSRWRVSGRVLNRCAALQIGLFVLAFLHPDKAWFSVALSSSYTIGACSLLLEQMCLGTDAYRPSRRQNLASQDEVLFGPLPTASAHLPLTDELDQDDTVYVSTPRLPDTSC
jgi:hypothetical protein